MKGYQKMQEHWTVDRQTTESQRVAERYSTDGGSPTSHLIFQFLGNAIQRRVTARIDRLRRVSTCPFFSTG